MEYRILGPLEVRAEGRSLALPGGRRCDLLAVLLLHAGRVVSADRLIDILWSEALPQAPATTLQGVVAGLRRALAPGHAGSSPLVTQASGYRLDVSSGELDLDTFEELVAAARRDMGQGAATEAAERLRAALALWRGPPLGGVRADELVQVEAPRLEERRLAVVEDHMDAELGIGRHVELVAELEAYVAGHPLRERLRGQLMVALYQAGRQADALEVYRSGRERLTDELGLDPGPELQRTQRAILTGDPALGVPAAATSPEVCPPAQLPTDVADFTGRAGEVEAVCDLLTGGCGEQSAAVRVLAIAGKAGVGKTALAVHAAHRMQASFPEGQLYVNLRGAEDRPLEAGQVLGWFLRALGMDAAAVLESVDERAQAYRSRLAGRRVLVVLDNAASAAQIRPLLPGSSSCGVLVTSRPHLSGLVGTKVVDLEALEPDRAIELLARLAGPERVAAEPEAVEQIVRSCGRLPLALRVAGARLAAHPHWGLAELAGRLADQRGRLDELTVGDLDVRASIGLSYTALEPDAQRTLCLLGLWEASDVAAWVPAALLDVSLPRADELVNTLVRARLLDAAGPDAVGQKRYRLHDLVRIYAQECAAAEESEAGQRAALQRALGAYLHLVDHAAAGMPAGVPRQEHGPATRWHLGTNHAATLTWCPRSWFESEQACLVTAVEQAATLGFDEIAWGLAAAQVPGPFVLGNRLDEWWHTHQAALAATRRAGNRRGEAVMLHGLGLLRLKQTRLEEADEHLRPALRELREAGSVFGEAAVLDCLGMVWHLRGHLRDAAIFLEQAQLIFRELHDEHAAACVSLHLGSLLRDQGQHQQALETLRAAHGTFRAAEDRRGQARTLFSLGSVHQAQNNLVHASELFQQAQHTAREIGDRLSAAYATEALATTHTRQGRTALAEPLLAACLEEFRELHDPHGQALVLGALGELHHAQDRPNLARECLYTALSQWEKLQLPLWRARTLRHLGWLHHTQGEPDAAQATWHDAFTLFQQLDVPEAAELATLLRCER